MSALIKKSKDQDPLEEKLNFYSHFIGALIGIVFLLMMLSKSTSTIQYFSSALYGLAIILSFSTSSAYHIVKNESKKHILRIFDHSAIFILIAGTYTPLALLKLNDGDFKILIAEWIIAFVGIGLKVFFTGRFQIVSVILYLLMGWLVAFEFERMSEVLEPMALNLILLGGLSYTLGVAFYSLKKIRFTHFIWHLFVLAGAVFHFLAVYLFVI